MQSTMTLMRPAAAAGAAIAWLVLAANLPAQEPAASDDPLRQKRLELLQSRVNQFELQVAGDADRKLNRGEQPILRWSNPVRDNLNDGVIYLFFDGIRPRAVVSVWADSPQANLDRGNLYREFVSLSGEPLECEREDIVLWSPKTGGLVDQELKETPAPAGRPAQRLTQMRELARRFEGANYKMDSPSILRLLSQPLYRYQGEDERILDGALFALVEGNDPEVLLLLEAHVAEDGTSHAWRYTLARMTSYRVSVKLDGREVFTAEPYWKNPRAPSDPYAEAFDGKFTLDEPASDGSPE